MSRSKVSILLFFGFLLQSCSSMNSAEINYTKDPEMEIGNDAGRNFQNYVYSIREEALRQGLLRQVEDVGVIKGRLGLIKILYN